MKNCVSARRPWRLACVGASTLSTALFLIGCGGADTGPVEDTAGHGKAVTKNMEDFMKTNPYKNVGKEKVQVK